MRARTASDDGVRSCALTRARRPKDELIRFVLGPDGAVVPDLKEKLPGRGVWVTAAQDTVAKAAKRNVFARALKTEAKVPEGLAGQVDRLLADAALSALGLANKAGEAVFGHAKVEEAHGQRPRARPRPRQGSRGRRLPQARRQSQGIARGKPDSRHPRVRHGRIEFGIG